MRWYQITVAARALLEAVLNLLGALDVRPLFRDTRRRPRIAFQAYAEHLAIGFAPVIERLRREAPEVDLHFLVLPHPHFTLRSTITLRSFVIDNLGLPASNVRFFWQALWQRYDVLVCTDVYARFPRRAAAKVLLKHGPGVNRRTLRRHRFRKTIYDFNLVLVNGEADCDVLRRFCTGAFVNDRVIAVGLPFLDRLQTCPESREAYLQRMGIAPGKRVALVGPSWRGLQTIQAREPGYVEELIEVLRELDWQVLVKMHACSFQKAMARGVDWAARLGRQAESAVRVDYGVDDVPALLHADILITDISSRAFDFMLLDKPVIAVFPDGLFTDDLDRERIRLMGEGAVLLRSAADLRRELARRTNGFDPRREERRRLARRVFANPGCATEAVVRHLRRQLTAMGADLRNGRASQSGGGNRMGRGGGGGGGTR